MALEDSARDLAINAIVGGISHLSLHTAFPATSGNEDSVTRASVTWAAASGSGSRTRAINETPTITTSGAVTVSSIGAWSASTAGTLHGGADVTDEDFGAAGDYQITAFSITVT